MKYEDYPALFKSADEASNDTQRLYLRLVRGEFILLLCAAVLTMNWFAKEFSAVTGAICFMLTLCVLMARTFLKPEQDWYKSRALAESVKTLTWRYMMRAEPFDSVVLGAGEDKFLSELKLVFDDNKSTAEKACNQWSGDEQITDGMENVRSRTLEERKTYYSEQRISEQHAWYTRKALYNKWTGYKWAGAGAVAYIIAAVLVILRVDHPEAFWPIEPFIVAGASILGWMQIKKYNELSAAYTLTAHEIGMLKQRLRRVVDDALLSEYTNEAELAFSREHTLWLARKTI